MCWQFKRMCNLYNKPYNINNWYRTDIRKPPSSRYIKLISTRYRLSDTNTISVVDGPSSSRYTFKHRTDIGSTLQNWDSTDIEIWYWPDIEMISPRYRLDIDIECLLGPSASKSPIFGCPLHMSPYMWLQTDVTIVLHDL